MPFLRAGFNPRSRSTGILGWTRAVNGRRFWPADLRQHVNGDFFWMGFGPTFWAWGEQCVLGSHHGFELAWEHQHGLARCEVDTRREIKAVRYVD